MKKADIVLPHRLLLNQSLRKEAEKLRTHIDEYQRKYDAQYQKNIEELDTTRDKLNIEFEHAQKTILESLSSDAETLQAISNAIAVYVSAYFERQLTYKKKEINTAQMEIVDEYIGFLSEQMRELGLEIDTLRERREMLSREADVSDIIRLVQLSGCALPVEEIHDAKELLDSVNKIMDAIFENDNKIEWYSLLNVKTILEERVSFMAEIQYITWIIEQKIQLSKELKIYREEQIKIKSPLIEEAEKLMDETKRINTVLYDKAKEIRFFWAQQIVYGNAELSDCFAEIDDVKKKQKRLKDDWDDYENERLSRKYQEISRKIDRLKPEIEHHRATRKEFMAFAYRMNVPIIKIGKKDQYDEDVFAETRLSELQLIEAEGMKAAEENYQIDLERLIVEKETYDREQEVILSEIAARLDEANRQLQIATEQLESRKSAALEAAKAYVLKTERQLSDQQKKVASSKKKLTDIQSADSRFILVRWFSDTPEETKAKAVVISAQKEMMRIQSELDTAKRKVSSDSFADIPDVAAAQKLSDVAKATVDHVSAEMENARVAYNNGIAEYDKKIKSLKPNPERPTLEERSEMNKIWTWKTNRATHSGKKENRS